MQEWRAELAGRSTQSQRREASNRGGTPSQSLEPSLSPWPIPEAGIGMSISVWDMTTTWGHLRVGNQRHMCKIVASEKCPHHSMLQSLHFRMHKFRKRWSPSRDANQDQSRTKVDWSSPRIRRTLSSIEKHGASRVGAGRWHGERSCSGDRAAKWTRFGESQLHVRDEVSKGRLGRTRSQGMVASGGRSVADGDDESRRNSMCRVCRHDVLLGGSAG
mmetsp:Transcript_7819/g.48488  ORF Transcript_7819/g.48488 Transcript_7819/m.48488 type:complete len:217 (-) Transcript_7819:2781-3431(-)